MPVAPVNGSPGADMVLVDRSGGRSDGGMAESSTSTSTSSASTSTSAKERPASMSRQHSRSGSQAENRPVASTSSGVLHSPRFSKAGLFGSSSSSTASTATATGSSPDRPPSPRRTKSAIHHASDSDSDEEDEEEDGVSLAQLIQARRRQASAPFLTRASSASTVPTTVARSPAALFGTLGGQGFTSISASSSQHSGTSTPPDDSNTRTGLRRGQRSRPSSRSSTVSGLHLDTLAARDFSHHGMVMTPTTEEWRSLGGQLLELARTRNTSSNNSSSSSLQAFAAKADEKEKDSAISTSTETSPTLEPTQSSPRKNSRISSTKDPLSLAFDGDDSEETSAPNSNVSLKHTTSFSFSSNKSVKGGFTHTSSKSIDIASTSSLKPDIMAPPSTSPLPMSPTFEPFDSGSSSPPAPSSLHKGHRSQLSESSRPNLSRGSLSSTSSKKLVAPTTSISSVVDGTPTARPPLDSAVTDSSLTTTADIEQDEVKAVDIPPPSPVSLTSTFNLGPVDPSKYSAVTGLRSIDDFIVQGEAGKGAYGTVRKAHLKGPDGQPVGPELIIKYVIKQRILADCWKKHKILGPIPIEVHVLDHLRRVPYVPRPPKRRKANGGNGTRLHMSFRRDSAPSVKEGVVTGHPNICGMLDFFEDGEFYYLIMPQAGTDPSHPDAPKGTDLFDYVDMHPDGLDPLTIRTILYQVTDALYFLHSHNIVHRDIKDENVVLSGDESLHVSLIDFGSAAYVNKEGKKFDTFSGTLDFAAPEVLKGARYGGKETDIWALGVLAYVLICGECPFWSPDEAMQGLAPGSRAMSCLRAKIDSAPNPHDRGAMELAVDVVCRALEVDPNKRPSADDLLDHAFFVSLDPTSAAAAADADGQGATMATGWRGPMGWTLPDEQDDVTSDEP